jgi:hypothetical protein
MDKDIIIVFEEKFVVEVRFRLLPQEKIDIQTNAMTHQPPANESESCDVTI